MVVRSLSRLFIDMCLSVVMSQTTIRLGCNRPWTVTLLCSQQLHGIAAIDASVE